MIPLIGLVAAICMAAVCVGQMYCYNRMRKNHSEWSGSKVLDENEQMENDLPIVRIKILQASPNQFANDTCNSDDKRPDFRHRTSTKIWSSPLRKQLERSRNLSGGTCHSTNRVVQAQIETNPIACVSNNNQVSELLRRRSFRLDHVDSPRQDTNLRNANDKPPRKLSSVVYKKWKKLKKMIIPSRSRNSVPFDDVVIDDTQRLNLPGTASDQPSSPAKQSTMLQTNQSVDVSTSTRMSVNALPMRNQTDEIVTNQCNVDENIETLSKQGTNDRQCSNAEAMQEAVSLIKRQTFDGKSVCDVRITGLSMNQSQLLDLLESTGSQTRSASIVTTEEASIISIKFYHRRDSGETIQTKDNSSFEGPFWKFYKNLPERLEDMSFSSFFRSQEQPRKLNPPSIYVSDHSRTPNGSRNNTSYIRFPEARHEIAFEKC
ncbi:uncharacterized protein LOC122401957 [Colletes gigas]|uniref:uncharacterized protein LOC122401957 n=1 Tax=Colletes gigas TaxID=935657 RepID=UPI001C9A80A8|nr:uncharacterized protein LOC122401957 [Colletes gigas]